MKRETGVEINTTCDTDTLRDRIAELEDELLRAKLAAEASRRAKSSFLANMNHEIRTPLHTSLRFLKLLSEDELTPPQRTKIDHVASALSSLLELFDDIFFPLDKVAGDADGRRTSRRDSTSYSPASVDAQPEEVAVEPGA